MIETFDILPALPTTDEPTGTSAKKPAKKKPASSRRRPAGAKEPAATPRSARLPRSYIDRDPDQHALRIAEVATDAWHNGFGGSRKEVAMGAVATLTLIGQRDHKGPDLAAQIYALPDDRALAQWMYEIWMMHWIARPDLISRARPLWDWLEREPDDHMLGCARSVVQACLRAGILELCGTDRRFDTDVLGLFYQVLYTKRSRDSRGQFFTPSSVSRMMAEMIIDRTPKPGERFLEPAAGTGGMFRAAAEVLRYRGIEPAEMHWYANDLDPMVAACCAVNMIAWRMGPNVVVGCGDSLGEGNALFDRALTEAREAYEARDKAWDTAATFVAFRTAAMAVDALFSETDDVP